MNNYIIATIKDWNINQFHKSKYKNKKNWFLISEPKMLTFKFINSIKPKYIFFPHWNKKVSSKITKNFECICFHETNLPFGRGGSPIQNLILRNYKKTYISAIKMTDVLDGGPIYLKKKLKLNGNADDIFIRASKIIFQMIDIMINKKIFPIDQKGKVTRFKRIHPKKSKISKKNSSLEKVYNHIRMLDAKTYPTAFIEYGNLRIEFKKPKKKRKMICSEVNIKLI